MKKVKSNVMVGVANENERSMSISDVEKWTPTKITQVGNTTYFSINGKFHSMNAEDFKIIFNK